MTSARLHFLGAAGTVTGSRFLIEQAGRRVLVDAGLFQGLRHLRRSNWDPFPVDPHTIDAVVLTHAHIDHSGWLPGLVRDGFAGPIHATSATCDLCGILLPDSAHLHEEQARFANERGFSRHHPALPLYTTADAEATLPLLSAHGYDEPFDLFDGATATLTRAGHILGSASVHLDLDRGRHRLLISGDLGRGDHPLLPGPETPPPADVVLVESTYGDRLHSTADADEAALAATIRETAARGGSVLIPAFAVDRTELILLLLRRLMSTNRIPTLPVFADSPMALSVLGVYRAALDHGVEFDPGGGLRECRSVEQSMAIADHVGPAIIISASGMATGGRVLHHLSRMLPDPRNAVVLTGFQAAGTRGRSLADGATEVRMHGRDVPVRCSITSLTSMSVHADADELIEWLRRLPEPPARVYVVHGEPHASGALQERITAELGLDARVPDQFDAVDLVSVRGPHRPGG